MTLGGGSMNNDNKWEYRLYVQSSAVLPRVSAGTPIGALMGDLYVLANDLGSDGWELVSAVGVDRDRVLFTFKRPKVQA